MMNWRVRGVCLALASLAGGWQSGLAQDDTRAAVVKSVSPKTIDGNAADWADIKAERGIIGADGDVARFKLAYDAEGLYALVHVCDDSPLRNGSQLLPELLKGGDVVGFCFGQANGRGTNQRLLISRVRGEPVALAMRPGYGDKKPYTYYTAAVGDVKFDFVAPLPEVQVAFDVREDEYTVEVKIPWSVVEFRPADGVDFPFDVQVILSNTAGTTNVSTYWWNSTGQGPTSTMDIATEAKLYPEAWGRAKFHAKDPGPTREQRLRDEENVFAGPGEPISFNLPRDARVSLIITQKGGWVVRELLRAVRLRKGRHTAYWDGRDRTGQLMPAGEYRYRIGYFDRIKTSFYGSVGNSGRPVYRTPDGNGSIGGSHGGPSAVAGGAEGVYMLHSVEEGMKCLRKIDAKTGKALWWASTGVFGSGFAVTEAGSFAYMVYGKQDNADLVRLNAATGQLLPIGGRKPVRLGKVAPEGLAVVGEKIFFSDPPRNRIGVVDLNTGSTLSDIAVPSPRGLCRLDDGQLLACSGGQVLKIDTSTGNAEPLIRGLEAPRAVAVDAKGEIYVADGGASQQIKRFSSRGRQVAAFGKKGGRGATAIPYDPLAFRDVAGLGFGPDGNLWLVEPASPRRFAKLSPRGQWIEDFYGPCGYATVGVDLDDFSRVYYQTGQDGPDYVETRIDYAAYAKRPGDPVGAWKVESLHLMSQNGVDRSAKPDFMSETATASYGKAVIFRGANGTRYFFKPAHKNFALWRWDRGRWVSAAAAREYKEGNRDRWALWSDADGDGLVQDGEVVEKAPPTDRFTWIDRELNVYGLNGTWEPAEIDERGVPRYAGGEFVSFFPAGARPISHYLDQESYGYRVSPPAADGARYYVSNIGAEQAKDFWDRASETRLIRMKDGRPQWIIGHHDGRMLHDGDSLMLINLAGEVDDVVIAAEVCAEFTAYTSDGLTLGWISKDAKGKRAEEGPVAWYVENVQPGLFLKDPKTGKRLLFGATTEDVRVLEIDGVFGKDITRIDGRVRLRSTWPRSQRMAGRLSIPYATWPLTNGGRYLNVDGYDWEWEKNLPAVSLYSRDALVAEVRLRRDAGALYVFADILGDSDFPATTGPESFGKALGLELMIGPDAPSYRETAAAGDTRLFLTARKRGDGFTGMAFACRPASGPLQCVPSMRRMDNRGGYEGSAPNGSIDFSAGLSAIPGASVAVMERFDGNGYRLEAEIPLAMFPEMATPAPVLIKRQHDVNKTETRLDLQGPVRFNVAVWTKAAGRVRRIAWMEDGLSGTDPKAMTPSSWGMANAK